MSKSVGRWNPSPQSYSHLPSLGAVQGTVDQTLRCWAFVTASTARWGVTNCCPTSWLGTLFCAVLGRAQEVSWGHKFLHNAAGMAGVHPAAGHRAPARTSWPGRCLWASWVAEALRPLLYLQAKQLQVSLSRRSTTFGTPPLNITTCMLTCRSFYPISETGFHLGEDL